MLLPNEPPPDRNQLVRYILGLLPEHERERIDEASIADDDVATQLRIVENDLIDDYVRGRLTGQAQEWFESHYLLSEQRRARVRFAASFLDTVDRAVERSEPQSLSDAEPAADETDSSQTNTASIGRKAVTSRLTWKLALAAAVLVVCGSLLETLRLGFRLNVVQNESAVLDRRSRELEQQLNAQRAANAAMSEELSRARESAAFLPATDSSARKEAVPAARTFALVLLPQTRSVSATPTLAIPRGVDRVAFELRLESSDVRRYRVGLRDPATNGIVWRSGSVAPRATDNQPSVSVVVPASVLKAQHYSLDLIESAAGDGEVAGSYAFQVLPR